MNKLLFLLSISCLLFSCAADVEHQGEIEFKDLETLLAEIETMATSVSCVAASSWRFVGLGSKACGGVAGYIAYSNQIDTEAFLSRVSLYNEKTAKYNEQEGVISDCAITPPPSGVRCEDGLAVLYY